MVRKLLLINKLAHCQQ